MSQHLYQTQKKKVKKGVLAEKKRPQRKVFCIKRETEVTARGRRVGIRANSKTSSVRIGPGEEGSRRPVEIWQKTSQRFFGRLGGQPHGTDGEFGLWKDNGQGWATEGVNHCKKKKPASLKRMKEKGEGRGVLFFIPTEGKPES